VASIDRVRAAVEDSPAAVRPRPARGGPAPPDHPPGPPPGHPGRQAEAWARHADDLAAWTDLHLVNRRDAFGRYIAVEWREDPDLTATTIKAGLTPAVLQRHYRGAGTGDLIGLHSTARDEASGEGEAADCWSRWLALDIDRHDDRVDPDATRRSAVTWHNRARDLGFAPLLSDSNGRGGYHLRLIFDGPAATTDVYRFGKWLCRDWRELGLDAEPETFPKQPAIKAGGFGNWLRLPGRHHSRDHWARLWDGERWLDGNAAIRAILATRGTPAAKIPAEALAAPKARRPSRKASKAAAAGDDVDLARQALGHVADLVDDYKGWLRVGMSLTQLGPAGLDLWDAWSQEGTKYQEGVCGRKWRSFSRDGGLNLGTLFHLAGERGWPGQGRNGAAHAGPHPGRDGTNGTPPDRARDGSPPPADGGPRGDPGDQPPVITITTAEHLVIDQAVAALAVDPNVYQRSNFLMTLLRDFVPKDRVILRPPGSPRITPLPLPRLRELLTKWARWEKVRKTQGDDERVPAHPPDWAVAGVAARGAWPEVRPIEAVTETPVLRRDGTILDRPGYDERTALLFEPNAAFPAIPPRATQDDASHAAETLLKLVVDFPFAGDGDRAAWLAALLTPLARFAIAGPCPLFLVDANTPGTGKSKLTDIVAIVSTGRSMPRTAYPDANDEMNKRITSIALAGDRLMLLDNIATTFGGSALDTALTGMTWRDRILGRSEMTAELPLFTVWYATGNNVVIKGDVKRRIVPCRLETREERPEERQDFTIEGDLLAHVLRERPRLVAAALTILRAHAAAGSPACGLTPMGSYEAWSRVVRDAVYWAIGCDPCSTRKRLESSDPEAMARAAVIDGWLELPHGRTGTTAASALKLVRDQPDRYEKLHDAFMEWSRNDVLPSARSLGMRLKALKGRVIDGKFFVSTEDRGTQLWRVIPVED